LSSGLSFGYYLQKEKSGAAIAYIGVSPIGTPRREAALTMLASAQGEKLSSAILILLFTPNALFRNRILGGQSTFFDEKPMQWPDPQIHRNL
jgi:hypothetical protein